MKRSFVAAACGLAILAGTVCGEEKLPVEMKLVPKQESYSWPYDEGPKKFEATLQELLQAQKRQEEVRFPKPPALELVLRITNTSKEKTTIHIEGDANVLTLKLKGPGVVTVDPRFSFTTEFRSSKPVELEAGKSVDVPVKYLADGFRRGGRYLYVTAPGEYTLSASYQLANADGSKGPVLKSAEVQFKIEDKK